MNTEIVRTGTIALERAQAKGERGPVQLLFIHGAGHGSWMWKNFLPYFSERGFDSWALNLRGHHLAPKVDDWGQVGAAAYLDDLKQAVATIGHNVVLVGHSMSAILALKYAESHPVEGIIVSQSGPTKPMFDRRGVEFPLPPPKTGSVSKTVPPLKDKEAVVSRLFDRAHVDDENVELVLQHMGCESVRAYGEILNLAIDASAVTAPVFVLGFDAAKLGIKGKVDLCQILADEFHARGVRTIEPGGHNYMLETNWQTYAVQFEEWIQTCISSR